MSRFIIYAAQYYPHMGGVEHYTYNLSKELVSRGHEVTVVTSNTSDLLNYEEVEGIKIYRMPCFSLMDGRYPVLKHNTTFRELHKQLKNQLFDFAIINARFYVHSIYGVRFAKKQGIKSIVIDHGSSHLTVHHKVLDFFGSLYERCITAIVKRYCKDFYGVSNGSVEWLTTFSITAKGVLYNAIDLENITSLYNTTEMDVRQRYNIPKDACVVSFTGRLLKEKGIPQLIKSIQHINKEQDAKVYLVLAGEGDLKEYCDKQTSDYIIPVGRLTFSDVIALLKASDIFCLPSDSEGFSTSLLEAAACSNYIVTTARGGARELLPDDSYGIVIEHNDMDSVYHALKEALSDQRKREVGIDKTYQRVANNFTWKHTADKVIVLVQANGDN